MRKINLACRSLYRHDIPKQYCHAVRMHYGTWQAYLWPRICNSLLLAAAYIKLDVRVYHCLLETRQQHHCPVSCVTMTAHRNSQQKGSAAADTTTNGNCTPTSAAHVRDAHYPAAGSLDVTVLGMNSGTAMDGIDCALVRYRQASPTEPLHMDIITVSLPGHPPRFEDNLTSMQYDEMPVPSWIKTPVLAMLRETRTTPSQMSQLNVNLGIMLGEAAKRFCEKHDILMDSIDLIGSHGQTIWLLSMPEENETRSAFCLGEGTVISAITGITTVTDFRMAEQAVGRQGAPLVALIDGLLLHHPTEWRICQNIGGIANLCVIPPDSSGGVDAMVDW